MTNQADPGAEPDDEAEDDVEYTLAEGSEGIGGQVIPMIAGGLSAAAGYQLGG
jgi:hypothetical protein